MKFLPFINLKMVDIRIRIFCLLWYQKVSLMPGKVSDGDFLVLYTFAIISSISIVSYIILKTILCPKCDPQHEGIITVHLPWDHQFCSPPIIKGKGREESYSKDCLQSLFGLGLVITKSSWHFKLPFRCLGAPSRQNDHKISSKKFFEN